jgi:DNA-directed RNA polymerase subunit F
MIINEKKPLSIGEAQELIDKKENPELKKFLGEFTKIKAEDAKKLREKINELDLLKIKSEHISMIINLLPDTKEELNKIFTDSGLDEEETKRVLDVVKEFK